jgi:hypothetical protein
MKLTRLRLGEMLATVGALALAVLTFRPWFMTPSGNVTVWDEFGVVGVLIVIVVVSALTLGVTTVTERASALPVASAVLTTLFAFISTIAILVWVLVRPGDATGNCPAGWLGLAASALILVGAWQSMRDERTGRYLPDDTPRRPAPPA